MALTLTPSPYQTVLDSDGNPVSGAKVNTYLAGTTTAASTYTTSVGDVANANPIVADSAGRFVAYLSAGLAYKFVITTSADVAVDEQDNVLAVPGSSVNLDIIGTAGVAIAAGEVCYISATGDAAGTAGLWYLADADLAYSSTGAVEIGIAVSAIAINTSGTIRIAGEATTATSTVVGTKYYVSATAGAITSSAPALARLVGIAPTTSSLILNANTLTIPVPVSQGGTGKTTLTAYGVLLGGTSTTGAVQPLTPAAAGQLLKSGGTGAVAAWTADPSVDSIILDDLTASVATFTDGSKKLVSNAITGTGNVVMSASPTLTGTIGAAALTLSTPLAVPQGGTGVATLPSGNVLIGAGTSDVSSTANISVAQGGTGVASLTANSLLLGAGTSDVTFAAPGTSGNVLTSNGTVWASAAVAAVTGTVKSINTAVGASADTTISGTTYGALNGLTVTFTPASATNEILILFGGIFNCSASAGDQLVTSLYVDGSAYAGDGTPSTAYGKGLAASNETDGFYLGFNYTLNNLAASEHTIAIYWKSSGGTSTWEAIRTQRSLIVIEFGGV